MPNACMFTLSNYLFGLLAPAPPSLYLSTWCGHARRTQYAATKAFGSSPPIPKALL